MQNIFVSFTHASTLTTQLGDLISHTSSYMRKILLLNKHDSFASILTRKRLFSSCSIKNEHVLSFCNDFLSVLGN